MSYVKNILPVYLNNKNDLLPINLKNNECY